MDSAQYSLPLKRSLYPIAVLTYVTGGLLPVGTYLYNVKTIRTLHFIPVAITGLGLFTSAATGLFCLLKGCFDPEVTLKELVDITLEHLWHLLGIVTFIIFTWKHSAINDFLTQWRVLETSLDVISKFSMPPLNYLRYLGFLLCVLTLLMSFDFASSQLQSGRLAPRQIQPWKLSSEIFYAFVILKIYIGFQAMLLSFFGESFASYTYRYLAYTLGKIEKKFLSKIESFKKCKNPKTLSDTKSSLCASDGVREVPEPEAEFSTDAPVLSMDDIVFELWDHYENLHILVEKAADLFGPILFFSFVFSFIACCCDSYIFLSVLRRCTEEPWKEDMAFELFLAPSFILLWFVGKTMTISHFCSSLPKQVELFQTTVSDVLHEYREEIPTETKKLQRDFQYHIQLDNWSPNPLGLFRVNWTTILSMASLTVTYVIVMFQITCKNGNSGSKAELNCTLQ